MKLFDFTLLITGPDLQSDTNLDALFEAGCDDATFGNRDRIQYADFHRAAPHLAEAIAGAIQAVETAVPGAMVLRVEPDELVSLTKIAERTSRTRESIRLLAEGSRGPGGFPNPLSWVDAKSKVWRWSDVAEWFETRLGEPLALTEDAETIATFNGLLEARLHSRRLPRDEEKQAVAEFARTDDALHALLA